MPNGSRLPTSDSLRFELLITFLAPLDFLHDVVTETVDYHTVFAPVCPRPPETDGVSML
jgi:hypothetical protein